MSYPVAGSGTVRKSRSLFLILPILFGCIPSLGAEPNVSFPPLSAPVMFNNEEADRILSHLPLFPSDNPWNQDISGCPVLRNSTEMIRSIGADKPLAVNSDMAFILVPGNQPRVEVKVLLYPEESDPGPFPIPDNSPIENWPMDGRDLNAAQTAEEEGDRHLIIVDTGALQLHEFYQARKTEKGWVCACSATFDLRSNKLRPQGWTSADAAGLPIFPAIIRYDEVQRGMVEHAMRFTVRNSRRASVLPATHFASNKNDPDLPRMGERFRLRADFDLSGFSPHVQAILKGLKKYGMFVADNGGDWRLSAAPDTRIRGLEELRRVKGSDFEVVDTSGKKNNL